MSKKRRFSTSEESNKSEDEDSEREVLEKEINELMTEMNSIKEQIYKLYNRRASKGLDNTHLFQKTRQEYKQTTSIHAAELSFYETFMKLYTDNDLSSITVLYSTPLETFGVQFAKLENDLYTIKKGFLSPNFHFTEEKNKVGQMSIQHISNYLQSVQTNLYAYSLRMEQIFKFKELDKKIRLFYTQCGTNVEMTLIICNVTPNTRFKTTLQLKYLPQAVRPTNFTVLVADDISDENLDLLTRKFVSFKKLNLADAAEVSFRNDGAFEFCI